MNKTILSGSLVADPELRTSGETPVANYRLAVPKRNSEEAMFVDVTSFGKAAEFAANYFKKGRRVLVAGRLDIHSFDRADGTKGLSVSVIAEEQEFADGKPDDM